jgi:hypothetical protein
VVRAPLWQRSHEIAAAAGRTRPRRCGRLPGPRDLSCCVEMSSRRRGLRMTQDAIRIGRCGVFDFAALCTHENTRLSCEVTATALRALPPDPSELH